MGNYNWWGDAEKLTKVAHKWFSYKGEAGQIVTDWGTFTGPLIVIGLNDKIL